MRRRSRSPGVGDMSGDVFGNGMLLERTIKLVAAFDHRDIFIDPSPDPERAWTERKRLFDLSRSSWQDYKQAIDHLEGRRRRSARSAKDIPLFARNAQAGQPGEKRSAAAGGDARDPEGAGRSPVVRRHRHLCARVERNRREGRRPRQRCNPRKRLAASLQGDRRRRESRHDPARPHRGGAARRAAQHRRDRQFGRGQYVRRRGQHQDRAERAGARGQPHGRGDRNMFLAEHDRRGWEPRAPQQLPADAGAFARRAAPPRISASKIA